MSDLHSQIIQLVCMAVERVGAEPADEQRYLELNFALDRAVERHLRYRELLDVFERGAREATPERGWAWRLAAGLDANLTGDASVAIAWLQEGRAQLAEAGLEHTPAASFLFSELSRAHYHRGENGTAMEMATRALQLARASNSLLAQAYSHHYLGLISIRRRDYDYARRQIRSAQELFERMNQRHGRARVLDSHATLLMDLGDHAQARTLLDESLAVKEELRDLRGQALTCGNLARLYTALCDYPQALHFLNRERELTSRVGDERHATITRIQSGWLHLLDGRAETARQELLEARALSVERQDRRAEAHACFALAQAQDRCGNREGAEEAIRFACDYFAHSDDTVMREWAPLRQAMLRDEQLEADSVQAPLERLRKCGAHSPFAEALFEVADRFRAGAAEGPPNRLQRVAALYAEALDVAEPAQAAQLASMLRARAKSAEGRAWVDAMLSVKTHKDELERAYAELRRAETLRDALTQMIVHDLKNPLTAITPWLQTIQMGALEPEETREYLQTVIDECDYLLRMIEDLNDVGRMQHEGSVELRKERIDLGAMLIEVCSRLQGRARESRLAVFCAEFPPLPRVVADGGKMRRVLENLVVNAIKYGRPPEQSGRPAEVWLSAAVEPPTPDGGWGYLRIQICDYGVGIPLSEAERVFEPYYQAEAGRKRKAGVGLGLAFSRMIVDAHGGTIWSEPNPSGGTVFAFRLPLPEPETAPAADPPEAGDEADLLVTAVAR